MQLAFGSTLAVVAILAFDQAVVSQYDDLKHEAFGKRLLSFHAKARRPLYYLMGCGLLVASFCWVAMAFSGRSTAYFYGASSMFAMGSLILCACFTRQVKKTYHDQANYDPDRKMVTNPLWVPWGRAVYPLLKPPVFIATTNVTAFLAGFFLATATDMLFVVMLVWSLFTIFVHMYAGRVCAFYYNPGHFTAIQLAAGNGLNPVSMNPWQSKPGGRRWWGRGR